MDSIEKSIYWLQLDFVCKANVRIKVKIQLPRKDDITGYNLQHDNRLIIRSAAHLAVPSVRKISRCDGKPIRPLSVICDDRPSRVDIRVIALIEQRETRGIEQSSFEHEGFVSNLGIAEAIDKPVRA